MNVKQFRYSSDNNLAYLIYGKSSALAIDGGAVDEILSFLKLQGLSLEWVANTHSHYDHTCGNQELLNRTGAKYLDNKILCQTGAFKIEGEALRIYHTPGHTEDSVTFHVDNILITGDTLFNGTVGNCFTDDLAGFFNSIKRLIALPGNTMVYAGHDYVNYSMKFARLIEPDNGDIDRYLEKYSPNHVCSTLEDELKVNPYLRFNDESMTAILKKRGLPVKTEYERWESLMKIE